jgi:exodeoxyribonuclease VII small subunit
MNNYTIPKSYEEAMSRLQIIIAKLEQGEVAVDDLESLMVESKQLTDFCQNRLRGIGEKLDQME